MSDQYSKADVVLTQQAELAAWNATPVGKALTLFENAVVRAWTMDTEDSFTDKDRKATKEAHEMMAKRRAELKAEISRLMVKP